MFLDVALQNKLEKLQNYFKALGSCAIAFSGGVDSTFLLAVAKEVLAEKCIAITISSALIPGNELKEAKNFCYQLGVKHFILEVDELATPGFKENPPERCYLCKRNIFAQVLSLAKAQGMDYVCEGSNLDDEGDYRPGMRAIKELDVKSPLRFANLTKNEIRTLSKVYNLSTWNKPSYACLASRIPYGDEINKEKLALIDAGEKFLHELGFLNIRLRLHKNLARLELTEADYEKIYNRALREKIYAGLKQIGFAYIAVDLLPYETGRLNAEILK